MAKVFGIHLLRLREGVDPEEFEQFARRWFSDPDLRAYYDGIGWKAHLVKGLRGDRAGGYAMLIEIESVEALERIMPTPEKSSGQSEKYMADHPETAKKSAQYSEEFAKYSACKLGENTIFTDYVVVAE
jgi:hypothetical protein